MASVSVYNMEGAQVGTIELSDSIFAVPVNELRRLKHVLK